MVLPKKKPVNTGIFYISIPKKTGWTLKYFTVLLQKKKVDTEKIYRPTAKSSS